MRQVIQSTGTLLQAFVLGSVATVIGTTVAFLIVPMRSLGQDNWKSLGQDNWKVASALMGSYIGGAINYVAISEALCTSPSVVAAGVAADNVICAVYFVTLFALASKIPPEASTSTNDASTATKSEGSKVSVLHSATALAVSFAICKSATSLTRLLKIQGSDLTAITAIVVFLAALLPRSFCYLAPAGEAYAVVLMQVFFFVVGASGSIRNVIQTAPSIFLFALIQVSVHLIVIQGLGRLLRFDSKVLLLASNANIGGPHDCGWNGNSKGWDSLVVSSILVGIFGISIATFMGIGFGVLKHM